MLRWGLICFIVLIILARHLPWLERLGIGRLPGDLRWQWRGKRYLLPLTSSILLVLLIVGLRRLF